MWTMWKCWKIVNEITTKNKTYFMFRHFKIVPKYQEQLVAFSIRICNAWQYHFMRSYAKININLWSPGNTKLNISGAFGKYKRIQDDYLTRALISVRVYGIFIRASILDILSRYTISYIGFHVYLEISIIHKLYTESLFSSMQL